MMYKARTGSVWNSVEGLLILLNGFVIENKAEYGENYKFRRYFNLDTGEINSFRRNSIVDLQSERLL